MLINYKIRKNMTNPDCISSFNFKDYKNKDIENISEESSIEELFLRKKTSFLEEI